MVKLSESSFIVAMPSTGLSFPCYPVKQHSHPGHALPTTSGADDIPISRLTVRLLWHCLLQAAVVLLEGGTTIFYGVPPLYQPSQLRPYQWATL